MNEVGMSRRDDCVAGSVRPLSSAILGIGLS